MATATYQHLGSSQATTAIVGNLAVLNIEGLYFIAAEADFEEILKHHMLAANPLCAEARLITLCLFRDMHQHLEARRGTSHKGADMIDLTKDDDAMDLTESEHALGLTAEDDVIDLTGDHHVIDLTGDHDVIDLTGDDDVIDLTGDHDIVDLIGDHDVIDLTGDDDVIDLTGDHDIIDLIGDHDVIELMEYEYAAQPRSVRSVSYDPPPPYTP